jgi:hypothetical protein
MRIMGLGVALIFVAHAALAGIKYEFVQTSRSDSDSNPPTDLTARAVIDGERSRVDFISGNAYPPGTYVISTDGLKKMLFVDPTQKLYTEVNSQSIAAAIGTSNITIENVVPTVTKLPDTIVVAGLTGEHYRLTMTYDITVRFGAMPLKQRIRTEIDKWTTVHFGDAADAVTSALVTTGNAKIDEIILAESTKIKGFPLKQTVKITKLNQMFKASAQSELKVPSVRTSSREMTVTAISESPIADGSIFKVPAGYRKNDFDSQVQKTQTQVLSVEPAAQ